MESVATRSRDTRSVTQSIDIDESHILILFTGQSGSGKSFREEVLRRRFRSLRLIQSYTTRKLRPTGDEEYIWRSQEAMDRMNAAGEFAWCVRPNTNTYATSKAHLDEALRRTVPSTMHLDHGAVDKLLGYVQKQRREPGRVFRFYVTCYDIELVKRRIVNRDPSIPKQELQSRLDNYFPKQADHLRSGLYHAVLDSTENHSEPVVLEQMMEHLSKPAGSPQKF